MWLIADIAAKDHVGGLPLVRSAFPKAWTHSSVMILCSTEGNHSSMLKLDALRRHKSGSGYLASGAKSINLRDN
jgi:hypothetical protein